MQQRTQCCEPGRYGLDRAEICEALSASERREPGRAAIVGFVVGTITMQSLFVVNDAPSSSAPVTTR